MPERFGQYELLELLGRGGMGEVYRAQDTSRDRTVAIKLLPKHLASDESFKTRFRRESQMAARLNDPHIIPIHDFGEIDGTLYIDMRLVEGKDLGSVLSEGGAISPEQAVKIVSQVSSALHAAHEAGLVHRDVKPSNILLSRWVRGEDADPFAYLVDFGIARAANSEGTAMTSATGTVGTVAYMSPERINGSPGDRRTDIYALGAVLYESVTGRKPFDGEIFAIMYAHVNTPPPKVSQYLPGPIGYALDAVVETAMAKDPARRYATALEFASAARRALRGQGGPGGPHGPGGTDTGLQAYTPPPTFTVPAAPLQPGTSYPVQFPLPSQPTVPPSTPPPTVVRRPFVSGPQPQPPQQPQPPGTGPTGPPPQQYGTGPTGRPPQYGTGPHSLPVPPSGKPRRRKRTLLIAGAAAAVVVVAGVLVAVLASGGGGGGNPTPGPTPIAGVSWSHFSAFSSLLGTHDGDTAHAYSDGYCTLESPEEGDPPNLAEQVYCTYDVSAEVYVMRFDTAEHMKAFVAGLAGSKLVATPITASGGTDTVGTRYTTPTGSDQATVLAEYCALPTYLVEMGSTDPTVLPLSALERDFWNTADLTSHVPQQTC